MTPAVEIADKAVFARIETGIGEMRVVRERFHAPIDRVGEGNPHHHLQLSLLAIPHVPTACFQDVWSSNRFEPMGRVFLLPAGSRIRFRSACRVQQSLVLDLAPAAIDVWFDNELEWTDNRLASSLNISNNEVLRLMRVALFELENPGFAKEAMLESLTAQICVTLTRHFHAIDDNRRCGGLAPWRMRLVDDYLATHLDSATIIDLSRHCGLSARQMCRAFKASSGISLGRHIADCRIRLAQEMLSRGVAVKEVAQATGFSAPANFATAFRRATGYSPREYGRS